mgnify:CR=1 FL=1
MKNFFLAILFITLATSSFAAGGGANYKKMDWQFEGVTGTFDKPSIQRGYQVYREVCASCHGMDFLYFRNYVDYRKWYVYSIWIY